MPCRKPLASSICLLVGVVLIVGSALYVRWQPAVSPVNASNQLEASRTSMALGRYDQARQASQDILDADPTNVDAYLVVAECFTKEGRLDDALRTYEQILDLENLGREDAKIAYQCAGEIELQRGGLRRAEELFRATLKLDPYFPLAHNRLAFMLGLEGRRWESLPHLVELIKQDEFSVFHLLLLANPRQNITVEDFLDRAKRYDAGFPVPRIAEAKAAIEQGQLDRAAAIVQELVSFDAQQAEIKLLEGTLYFLQGDGERFIRWSQSLNLEQESHPDCWVLRAEWARQRGETETAIRCFAEAYFRDPNCLEAAQALTQLLSTEANNEEVVDYFQRRTRFLERLEQCSHLLHEDPRDTRLMEEAFTCCDWLERYWEAWGWSRAALAMEPNLEWAQSEKASIEEHLVYDLPQTIIFKNINHWNYSRYPLPQWAVPQPRAPAFSVERGGPAVAFRDVSAESGLDFRYECGHQGEPDNPLQGRRMYEVPGGGVAAIDYDRDLFPDVYFGQGARKWNAPDEEPMADRLYRNQSGERFVDVTLLCGITETSFTHGVAAGDFNNDGFPDLYVANLGVNCLYVNNGDGTFSDAGAGLPQLAGVWTTSAAIADLNADGAPDLYDVNYLHEEAYERYCEHENGYLRACSPRIFRAERDRVLLGNGDGTFLDGSSALPFEAADSRGLGIVIADFFGTGRTDVFVANDMTANNLYVRNDRTDSSGLSYRDDGLVRGVALDRRGRAQACMGVAFGDLDGNQTFDLFVTNFYGDYNTLYLQEQEMFSDLSHSSNLAALSFKFLGFGTQALDAELDGDLDLFVANGHIDDFTFQGIPYRMRAQMLINLGRAKFEELTPQEAGPYFAEEHLGRGVAKLDWNRDGREDILVSHLDTPAVLLSNESRTTGRALVLSFAGTKLARDPIGTRIEVRDGDEVRLAQVTAGSGYLASNEPVVVVPILHDDVVSLRVRWPDQHPIELRGLKAGGHYRIIEGVERVYALP